MYDYNYQPLMALIRPHPGTKYRPIFNYAHWFVGTAAHILGVVTIFFGFELDKADAPDYLKYILAGYVGWQALVELILEMMACCCSKKANGTSIHTRGRRSVSLAIGHRGQYNHEFYLADVTRPILNADFFTQHGLTIDLSGKCLLSLDNISIVLRETKSPLTLARLVFHLPNEISSPLQQFSELLTPHFHHSTNKHDVEHHIVTHGPPSHARARRLDLEKLSAAKSEFLQMEEMGIVQVSLVFTPPNRP
ncbi:transposon ty3-g Gag-Pol polyprotein [Plakobranchus ocellatus]|uniref:Transposon ty3-g Gag-Pol polyprotein n=1 Tax=Plakobranchus ocellatus TaxID=259542 RepID=A0AAV4AY72_9GAST|nr:transposon ty3-g Gag-Pol polyprotein [Plakobranchus ocellatus]